MALVKIALTAAALLVLVAVESKADMLLKCAPFPDTNAASEKVVAAGVMERRCKEKFGYEGGNDVMRFTCLEDGSWLQETVCKEQEMPPPEQSTTTLLLTAGVVATSMALGGGGAAGGAGSSASTSMDGSGGNTNDTTTTPSPAIQ